MIFGEIAEIVAPHLRFEGTEPGLAELHARRSSMQRLPIDEGQHRLLDRSTQRRVSAKNIVGPHVAVYQRPRSRRQDVDHAIVNCHRTWPAQLANHGFDLAEVASGKEAVAVDLFV